MTAGKGDDTISVATANFDSADTIVGGDGDDTLSMTDASTVVDADFTNVTSVEEIKQTNAAHNMTLTLGALSSASGLETVTGGTGTTALQLELLTRLL